MKQDACFVQKRNASKEALQSDLTLFFILRLFLPFLAEQLVFFGRHGMDEDLVPRLNVLTALAPVVGRRVRKERSSRVERRRRNRAFHLGVDLLALPILLIVNSHHTFAAGRRKNGVVLKRNDIYRVLVLVLLVQRELGLHWILVQGMDLDRARDITNSEPLAVRKAGNAFDLVFQGGFHSSKLTWLGRGNVDNNDLTSGRPDDEQISFDVHGEYLTRQLDGMDRMWRTSIPEFECLVPRTRNDKIGRIEETDRLDSRVVPSNLRRNPIGRDSVIQTPHADSIVDATRKDN